MKILIACEFSGVVREAFKAQGHDAWSCDLLPTEIPGQHIQGDVREILDQGWDLMIAHPPCTYLCNSGVRWLHEDCKTTSAAERWHLMQEAAEFFRLLLSTNIPRVAVENPIMHKYAKEIIGQEQTQICQPWWFGDGKIKAIGLWLQNLPELKADCIVEGREPFSANMSPSPDRGKLRSITYAGFARAMAQQWGGLDE